MVRYDRISIPDAYIIDEMNEKKRPKHDLDGIALPVMPAFDVYPRSEKLPDENEEYQSRVIIIEI